MNLNALSQRQIADLLSVTPRSTRDWASEGFPRNPDGTYPGPACVTWFVERRSRSEELDPNRERARKDKELADKLAMENAARRGELYSLRDLAEILAQALAAFRSRLLALSSKLAPRVNPENPNLARDIIAREVEAALDELAGTEFVAEPSQSGEAREEPADDPEATAAVNGERVGRSVSAAQPRKQRRARPVSH